MLDGKRRELLEGGPKAGDKDLVTLEFLQRALYAEAIMTEYGGGDTGTAASSSGAASSAAQTFELVVATSQPVRHHGIAYHEAEGVAQRQHQPKRGLLATDHGER